MEQLIVIIGGICLFFYGMQLTKEGLQHKTGDRIRHYILNATRSTWRALALGIVGTFCLQSSTAAMVMLIGFTNTGLVELTHALAVALGAGIGTSLFVMLLSKMLSFPIQGYAVLLLVVGLLFMQMSRARGSNTGKIILGFGLVLYGLKMIATTGEYLTQHPMILEQLMQLSDHNTTIILVAGLITVFLQSSTATLGILLSLSLTGTLPQQSALCIVLGANLGTTAAVLLASLQGDENGKRTAMGLLLIKLMGVVLITPFLLPLGDLLNAHYQNLTAQIAVMHLGFNTFLALCFTWSLPWVAKFMGRLIPRTLLPDSQFQVKYLDKHVLNAPTLALGNVVREVIRMGNIAQDMFVQFMEALENTQLELVEKLEANDDQIDILNREIKFYLARISQAELTEEQAKSQLELLSLTTNLEEVGDIINRNLCGLIRKKNRKQVSFSQDGWKDLRHFHQLVLENFNLSIAAFSTRNLEIAKKVARHKKNINSIFDEMQHGHLNRLREGLKESIATSSVHIELLTNMLRVNVLICKMVNPLLGNGQVARD